jgi:hypothetical protein
MPSAPHRNLSEWSSHDVDRNGLVMLERDECLRRLGSATLGRLGLTSGALPAVLPVNFWFDGEQILIRTSAGTKLEAATRDSVVAFEIDEIDPVSHTGWSVMVQGMARHVTDPAELERIRDLPLARWAPGGGGHIVAIRPEIVSGREIHPAAHRIAGGHHG